MRVDGPRRSAWRLALAMSAVGGILCVLFYFVIPELGFHGLPERDRSVGILAPLTVLFAAVLYTAFVEDESKHVATLHLAAAGIVGGVACDFVLNALPSATPISLLVVALSAVIGAVLAMTGVFGLIARGL